jgi:SAM-dependent methyltransferase
MMPPLPTQKISPRENIWDGSADMYNLMAGMERSYTYNQINCIPTTPEDTVLDIGCGPGRISTLIAERVRKVTSVDSSEKMLEHCLNNTRKYGVTNLEGILLDWMDEEACAKLPKHDIVIASRSVGMKDILKLNRFAEKYCVVIAWANAPCIPDILNDLFAGTSGAMGGRGLMRRDRRLGYNVTYNMVYDLGFDPNINIVTDGFTSDFSSRREAYDTLRQLKKIDDAEMPVFQKNLDPWLTEHPDGSVTFRRETRSFVLWWKADPEIHE